MPRRASSRPRSRKTNANSRNASTDARKTSMTSLMKLANLVESSRELWHLWRGARSFGCCTGTGVLVIPTKLELGAALKQARIPVPHVQNDAMAGEGTITKFKGCWTRVENVLRRCKWYQKVSSHIVLVHSWVRMTRPQHSQIPN